ncbi:MAG: hypothetical protein WCJ66_06235, partial [Verrucomicrobiota bacterium]
MSPPCQKFFILEAWQFAGIVHKRGMFSASQLTTEQKASLVEWAGEGATMSDLQRRLKEEFQLGITYME